VGAGSAAGLLPTPRLILLATSVLGGLFGGRGDGDAVVVEAQFEKGVAHDLTARLCKFDQRGVVDFRLPGEPLQ
jgi:hypothetical protein